METLSWLHFFWLLSKVDWLHVIRLMLYSSDLRISCTDRACDDHYYNNLSACDYLQSKACESWRSFPWMSNGKNYIKWDKCIVQNYEVCTYKVYKMILNKNSEADVLVNMKYQLIWSYWTRFSCDRELLIQLTRSSTELSEINPKEDKRFCRIRVH